MAWKEIIYQYDGSFEGLLCCIYESYTQKERPTTFLSDSDAEPCLYEIRMVPTVQEHTERIERSLIKLSPDVLPFLRRAFLTCLEDKELAIYNFIAKLYKEGSAYLTRLSDDDYQPLLRAVRHLTGEVEKLRGFLRFSEHGGMLSAEIEPENRVLPLLRSHFCERCHNECFFIYDRTHREALFYANGRSRIVPLDSFEPVPPNAEEEAYRKLWRRFYDTIAIRERENPRCCMSNLPKRYRGTMTEFQPENDAVQAFSAKDSPQQLIEAPP
ncbi:MAG: TIGR03915 family putative DNA repair protein [Oscillospiraceae bacterium]|nr:TIGR03915 family putative DNA repair protein [Oscillospiraceae bacterium]